MPDSLWCFQCRAAYSTDAETCAECGVGLVDHEPKSAETVGGDDDAQLGYELHDWAFESRRMLEGMLTNAGFDHAWQGATLIILEHDEEAIDDLVEEVERTTLPTLDRDKPKLSIGMEEWPSELQSKLTDQLGLAGVPCEFDEEGDLVIHEEDEETFDRVVDLLGEDDDENEEDKIDLDGLALNDLLTNVFECAQSIARDARASTSVLNIVDHAETLADVRTPFGYNRVTWRGLIYQIEELVEVLQQDGEVDEITAKARSVRDQLHQLI